jgi:hypothetical protein
MLCPYGYMCICMDDLATLGGSVVVSDPIPPIWLLLIIIIIFINSKWVDTRWQWSFYVLHMHRL